MLRFKPEVRIGLFDQRAGLVLHYASVWSLSTGIDVVVHSPFAMAPGAGVLHADDLAWHFRPISEVPEDATQLARYLASRLPADYGVARESDRVHVEFDMRRKV